MYHGYHGLFPPRFSPRDTRGTCATCDTFNISNQSLTLSKTLDSLNGLIIPLNSSILQELVWDCIIRLVRKQLLVTFLIFAFLFLGTTLVVLYGRGYRFGLNSGRPDLSGTGLLVATSTPNGASVFINGHLTTATDNTINLTPQEYSVKIVKEGYSPWEKRIKIQKEVVAKAEALLFSTTPKLEGITANGVENPVIDPSLTKIAYTTASESAKKRGIYVLDMSAKPILTLRSASTQIVDDTLDTFSKAHLSWSPDGKELLATISGNLKSPTTYLLRALGFNDNPKDVTEILASTEAFWQKDKLEKEKSRLDTLKPALQKMIAENFNILAWSPDETKILYQASSSATLPLIIKPRLAGVDATPEERSIKKDSVYVYDIKEDKNYKIDAKSPLTWLSDSKHLLYIADKKINILEYDGTNSTTVYAGPFVGNFVFPWTNVSKILMLTDLGNSSGPANLYTIELK